MALLLFFPWLTQAETASAISVRTYGEASTLESEGGMSSLLFTKMLRPISSNLSVYAGAQIDSYRPDIGGIDRVSPLAGIEYLLGPIRPFAEFRYVEENPKTTYSKSDPRFGVTGGFWAERVLSHSMSLISDTYFEYIAMPRFRWTPTLLGFSKLGLRMKLARALALDPFLEAYGKESSDPAFGRDALEGRGGARVVLIGAKWSAQLAGFRRFSSFTSAPEARWRALLSMGGEF